MKIEAPFFSIILIIPNSYHLVSVTLDSLREQTLQDFELILVEYGISEKDLEILKNSMPQLVKIYPSFVQGRARLMNKGIGFARGRYVHFFLPGDVFLSKHVLADLKNKAEENHFPQIISSGYLEREEEKSGEVICRPISIEILKQGHMPTRLQSICFLKSVLEEVRGFDKHFEYREDFELMCRLLKKKREILFLPRILVDYVFRRKFTKEFLGVEWETMRILYRQFGIIRVLFWFFLQDHFFLVQWWFKSIKQSFFRRA